MKLTIDYIAIEVTRRCNLRCAHCLRGNAQNIDISTKTLDTLVEQVDEIYKIFFTGGEPTLNVAAMQYTLDACKKKNVLLHAVEVITNGVLHSAELVDVLKQYKMYIDFCSEVSGVGPPLKLSVSKDKYHVGADANTAFQYYSDQLMGIASVEIDRRGETPIKVGRAQMLADADPLPFIGRYPHAIEIMEKNSRCDCRYASEWKLSRDNQKIVCCQLYLSATGILLRQSYEAFNYEWVDSAKDGIICDLSSSYETITNNINLGLHEYNQRFPPCSIVQQQEIIDQKNWYRKHPKAVIHDLLSGYKEMQYNPVASNGLSKLLEDNAEAREQLDLLLAIAALAEGYPEEVLLKYMPKW